MDGTVDERSAKERRSMSEQVILVDVADRVAVVTLNRPESRNALNPALNAAIPEAIAGCDKRDDVDVIVLTGADPAFCAGVDLKELTTDSEVKHIVSDEHELIRPFPETAKPVIGAINGAAVTGGFEVALTCDFLVASERARFADTHARVGIMPGWGLTVLLAEAVGHRRAREMSVTGNFVDARTALEWGLVNHVVPHDELIPFCRQLGADIVSNDQLGVRNVLATYREEEQSSDFDTRRIELRRSREWLDSASGVADEVARRRDAIMERGRTQQG
jgi:enoyl-CoA hydratase